MLSDHWSLFPNPAENEIWWEVDWKTISSGTLQVRSIYGQSLQSEAFAKSKHHRIKIDLKSLPAGIYFLEINVGEHRFTERFVKQ